jgi:hypothetical protein
MIRKFLMCASLAGLMMLGISAVSQQTPNQPHEKQAPKADTKSVSGTVAAIGSGGHSFTLEVSQGANAKHTMEFVVDNNTQVQGPVKTGTSVMVEYQAMDSGQNLAVSVTAQAA